MISGFGFRNSKVFQSIDLIARQKDDILFPCEAMDLIKEAYGNRADNLRPETLVKMINDLCLANGYEAGKNEIICAANDFIYGQ
jgi:hypothetical protein